MRLMAFFILLLSLVAVTGCERVSRMTGAPSKTSLPDYYPAGTEKGQKVAVCYGGATTSMEALAAAAAELCKEPGSTVELVTEDLHLNECPLLKKRRAVFACHEPR
jgi:hypothetical protein